MKFYCFLYSLVGAGVYTIAEKVRTLDGVYEAERAEARIPERKEVKPATDYPNQVEEEDVRTLDGVYEAERVEARISEGIEVESATDYPYQVQITVLGTNFCSGVIITEYHILTAAHCFSDEINPSAVQVRAGSIFRDEGIIIPISEIVLHREYNDPMYNCDIAYLTTTSPIVYSEEIQPAALFRGTLPNEITVTGWGNEVQHAPLKKVNLSVIGQLRCETSYPEVGITKDMFCAEDTREFNKGACKGDGGSPASDVQEHNRVFGVSSFSKGCGEGMAPSVFVNLQSDMVRQFIVNGTGVEFNEF